MAARYYGRGGGAIFFDPTVDPRTGHGDHTPLYAGRRPRPGLVRVKPVSADRPFSSRQEQQQPPQPPKRLSGSARTARPAPTASPFKLAISREQAKRLLRSVIAPNSSSNNEQQTSKADKRRSWSPTKRQQSIDSNASADTATSSSSVRTMRANFRNSIAGPITAQLQRPRLGSETPTTPTLAARTESLAGADDMRNSPRLESRILDPTNVMPTLDLDDEKPLAAGNGVLMGIHLAEPVLFLQGFENNEAAPGNTAMLRGGLHIRVQKAAKIKAITLKFRGVAVTKWPEGIPPKKTEFEEKDTLMAHTWPFFNAQFENAERGTNADHVQLFKGPEGALTSITRLDKPGADLTPKEARKLALSVNQSRSFGKGDPPPGPSVAAKGYRTFLPGDYLYNFELPLDSRLPETIDVDLGSVKYELEATLERAGAFRANLLGTKEVTLIRAPSEGSLEQVEPIAISRNWEDQLHYDIVISGKSFPLGSQVPIAFKLTPLAKVQCHRIKVLVTENIEYFCSNKRVHRMEPTRKVQLFEKRADAPPVSAFPGSTMRVTAGGGIPYDQRAAAARGEPVTPLDPSNLLGRLEGESNIGPTEMEFSVQLPNCASLRSGSGSSDRASRLHFDTTYQNIQVHHWIKIVMRLSKPDPVDPAKRRHFEISIDSPFHILSCRATQANISLPAYMSPEQQLAAKHSSAHLFECGCPGAARRRNSPTSFVPTLNSLNAARTGSDSPTAGTTPRHGSVSSPLTTTTTNSSTSSLRRPQPSTTIPRLPRPQSVHVAPPHHTAAGGGAVLPLERERPIHLLRAPSFNPPAFEDDEPPPPLVTPPPQYDSIVTSPTSGLADYFARLSDYDAMAATGGAGGGNSGTGSGSDEEDGGSRSTGGGRVNVPLTPGGRVNRSMDLTRSWVPVGGGAVI